MATPAHARVACPEQKTPESGDQEGSESLKNGTTLEDSDDSTGNVLVKNRVRSPAASAGGNPQHREMTMDSFQDGGTAPQPNSRPASANIESSFPAAAVDRSRLDYQGFNQSNNNRDGDDFRNSQDSYNHGGCDVSYARGSYGGDQHGGQGNTSEMTTNSQPNKMYPQYNQAQMRPGYPQGPRSMGPQPRPYPGPNSSQQQQRFLSGPSLSQQTGPTPTLNQLLQAPNSLQRYHNNYEYSANQGMHKNMGDPNSAPQYQGPNSSWGNMRGASGYPQQMSSSVYRNQGGPMPDPSMKRPYSQMSSPAPASQGQYPPQQQYHPYSQSQQPQGAPPTRPINQNYPPQQQYGGMQPHGTSQQSTAGYDHQRQAPMGPYTPQTAQQSQQQPQQPPQQQSQPPPPTQQQQQQQNPPSQQQPPQQQQTPSQQQSQQQQASPSQQQQQPPPQHVPSQQSQQQQQQQQQQQPPQQQQQHSLSSQQSTQQPPQQQSSNQASQDASVSEELSAESNSSGNITPGLRNPTTPPHPVVSPHRPAPSPSGSSTGSPSMSPALGQQPNIPMPPRPSSNQSENSGQVQMTQPPMTAQGYNQQMAPPSAMYGNKMHQNMMGGSSTHMPPYSSQSSGHYPQSGYHRPPGTMHTYGSQSQNNYPGPSYPGQSSLGAPHRMPSHPSSAPSNFSSPSAASNYNSSQYPGGPPSSGFSMNNMMPPPNQYPKSATMPPPTGGAQAAAQAAVIAAAASSTGIRQSPMYLRQHLQQKIYANNYNSSMGPGTPGSNGGQETPMPPPASTPSSQPMSMNQSSMPPSSASLGNASSCDGPVPASMVPAGFTQTSAPSSLGISSTTITQSISSPVPSAVTVSSPSIPDMMQSQQVRNTSMGGSQGPPPPPVMDEGSQASNASASSSLPEERVETPKPNNKPTMSHPPTPNTLPSPGAASMSSFHDEFESVSSPSWPRTPASPVINNQTYDHHPIKRPDGMLKLYDLSDDPDRRLFLDKLIMYQEERGTPLSQCPTISKQPLDLYRLYMAAKERGGFVEVMKGKMWKEIAGLIGIGASSSAAYTLRKQYIKHLLPFECKFDRGGIDPGPLISSLESNSRKKNAKNAGGPMMDGYGPSPYPGGYPPNAGHPGMLPGSDYPGPGHHPSYQDSMHHPGSMVNHSGSEGAMDPFSDEMQGSQYPQRHNTSDSYGYPQSSANSNIPPYSGNQPNVPSSSFGYSNTSGQQEAYNEQYSNTMVPPSDASYSSRNMVPDPYAPPPGGYPPNRTVGPSNSSQYPPYPETCNQERYDQNTPQSPMIRPNNPSSSVIGPSPQADSSYPSHRYPSPSIPGRDNMPPQQMGSYQGRPMGPSQYPGPNSQTSGQSPYPPSQPDSYRNTEFQPQMSRLQSTLIQRLLPKNQTSQNYPGGQQGMYGQSMPPPNKVAPPSNIPPGNMYQRDMYGMGAKRHSDYSKGHGPMQDQYHMGNYPHQQSQGPYGDRSQYPYRPSHGVPPQAPGPPQQGWPRDNRQYSGQNQYPPNQRDNWDISRHGEGPPPPGSPAWSRYGAPQPDSYSHHMGPSMGPKMMARGYGAPNKMSPHAGGPPPQYGPQSQRKEVIFPPDAVEAVTPLITKRRRLIAKDIAPIEAWRIMMALKSGLLGESTWALDVLAILVHDDATVLYFGLSHLPGLLEVLMDHYRRCLNLIFDLSGDLEVGFMLNPGEGVTKEVKRKWYELECDIENTDSNNLPESNALSGDKINILDSTNYTYKTRCRKIVRTQEEEALFLFDPDKKWDVHEGFISGSSHWQHGGGEYTGYIQTHFENTERRVRFVRVLKDSKKNKKTCESNSDVKNKLSKSKLSDGSSLCKRECGSDTEEDESLSPDSPKSTTLENSSDVKMEVCDESSVENNKEKSVEVPPNSSDKLEAISDKETSENSNSAAKCDSENNSKNTGNSESSYPKIRPMTPTRKRRAIEDLEDESYNRDEPSLCTISDAQDSLARRCICISSILRNLSFVPGNDTEMSKHPGFLLVLGRLLLLHHVHSPRKPPQRHYDREEDSENSSIADSCSSLNSEHEWWWDMLHIVRENTLVTLANIAGQLDLAPFPEEISFPILDGLMHWVTCPSSYAQDPLPTQPSNSVLSPQRLSLEALSKLSVLESNVDLMMATPPWVRIDRFFSLLSKWLSRNEDQVLREFSVVLLSNLSQADSSMARAIALQGTCIPLLITFVEQAEQSALQVANNQGINALRENPELMGTTLDMVRRAAGTLRCLARVPSNRTLFLQHQQRLLALVMSQILDQGVASIIADVLFECSQDDAEDSTNLANSEKEAVPLISEAAT